LVINIPYFNEEKTLPLVLRDLPKKITGISKILVQVVDDGSTDNTVAAAKNLAVHNIIRHKHNLGLGMGADIFMNTDADNQYPGRYIKDLVMPVLKGEADIVIGNTDIFEKKGNA
jgi:glycosyltransferase involved in cell wall biosynthesis